MPAVLQELRFHSEGCLAFKAWGRGGFLKTHVSLGDSSGENETLLW